MATTLANLNSTINDRRRDTTSNSVDMTGNGFRAINGTLQLWNQGHDWPWQIETTTITYNEGITIYPLSSSLNYKAIVDVRPQLPGNTAAQLYYVSNSRFDSDTIHTYRFAVRTQAQGQQLRLKYTGNNTLINGATTYDGNGTWVGASAISSVATDSYESFDLPGSVRFSYSGTSGTLTNSTMTALDLSRYQARSNIYFNVYLTSVTSFTSITLKVGTDASNYITGTITTDYLGNALVAGWNKVKLAWTGSTTTVGTITATSIGYLQVTIDYSVNPSTTLNRIENFFVAENIPMVFEYYTNFMALSSTTKSQIFTNSATTTDNPLWTGEWDWVTETFINSTMESIFFLTGEYTDMSVVERNVMKYIEPLKARLPSKRRYPQFNLTVDLNN